MTAPAPDIAEVLRQILEEGEKPFLEINFARAVIAASDNRVTWMQRWPDRAQLVANPEGFTYDPL